MHQTDYDWSKLIAPVALVLALGGLGFILLLTVALSFMYGIKILWEGNRKKKHPYVPRNVKISGQYHLNDLYSYRGHVVNTPRNGSRQFYWQTCEWNSTLWLSEDD